MPNTPEVLETCFVCNGKVFEIGDKQYGCDTCKRIWVRNENEGQWETIPRRVKLLKKPEPGDNIDDIIEPIIEE